MTLTEQERSVLSEYLLREARRDPAAFNRLVYRDSRTGEPWATQQFQREWEEAIEAHDRIVIFAPAGHGKTEAIARSWLTRKIGENPNLKAAILCNEQGAATERLVAVANDIRTNDRLRAVYPHLAPDPDNKWRDDRIFVKRELASKDPTLQAIGIHGAVIGARLDIGVVDDPCDFESTFTDHQRRKLLKWYQATFESRFDGRGKIVVIMTSWHEDDLGHALVRDYGYRGITYQACDEDFGNILWPDKYTEEILRSIHQRLGPIEFARTMRNVIMDDSFRRIKMEWIQKALDRGLGVPAGVVPAGAVGTYCGVDPAGGKSKKKGDKSALFTFSVMGNGDRYAIEAEEDRITSPELRQRISTRWNLYKPRFYVEDNGVQDWLRQEVVESTAIPITGLTTTVQKWDPATGVESIGVEMFNGKWIIPSVPGPGGRPVAATPGLQAWVDQMANFEHGAHTGDTLMACHVGRCGARENETRQKGLPGGSLVLPKGLEQSNPWG